MVQRTFEQLARDLQSPWPWVCRDAARALGQLGDVRAVPELIRVLHERRLPFLLLPGQAEGCRRAASAALGELGDGRAVRALARKLRSRSQGERWAASRALCSIVDRIDDAGFAVEALVLLPSRARHAWRGALSAVGTPSPDDAARSVDEKVCAALVRLDRPLAPPLLQALRDYCPSGPPEWTQAASRAGVASPGEHPLGVLAEPGAVGALVRIASAGGRAARRRAVDGWAGLWPHTFQPLLDLMGDGDASARIWAAEAFREAGVPSIGARLEPLLADRVLNTRLAAAVALARTPTARGTEVLQDGLTHGEPEMRRAAAEALGLGGVDCGDALQPLRAALEAEYERETRQTFRDAIGRIERALQEAPSELESAPAPAGSGTELEAAERPAGRGTEPEAAGP